MIVGDLITRIRTTLQDSKAVRWTDNEVIGYINDGIKDIAHKTGYFMETEEFENTPYTLAHEPLYIVFIEKPVISLNGKTIESKTPNKITYVYVPDDVDAQSVIDDVVASAVVPYALMRCYEKENDEMSFRKVDMYNRKYMWELQKLIKNDSIATKYQQDYLL